MTLAINVNGLAKYVSADADTPLLWVLRDELQMVGTKFGCGMALCGACTVHIDGQATRSCITPVGSLESKKIITIEGAQGAVVDAVKQAWVAHDVVQCGYCQPGQIMAASALLSGNRTPNDEQIDIAMAGNLCRCGTYPRIRAAVKTAAASLK